MRCSWEIISDMIWYVSNEPNKEEKKEDKYSHHNIGIA
jgi:hypothetical protein